MLSDLEARLLAHIDDDELIRWAQELTRIPSVWRPEQGQGEEAAARWVEARCRELGLETHFDRVAPGRPNVIAYFGNGPGRTLMFEGHTDVVTEVTLPCGAIRLSAVRSAMEGCTVVAPMT